MRWESREADWYDGCVNGGVGIAPAGSWLAIVLLIVLLLPASGSWGGVGGRVRDQEQEHDHEHDHEHEQEHELGGSCGRADTTPDSTESLESGELHDAPDSL